MTPNRPLRTTTGSRGLTLCVALVALAAALTAPGIAHGAARVRLRVEGANGTVFNGNVMTAPTVIMDSVGTTYALDGKAMCALDEGARLGAFDYVVKSFPGFGLFVDSIAGEYPVLAPPYPGWMYRVNGAQPPVGADAYVPKDDDEVLFYYGTYDASPVAVQISPPALAVGSTLTVTALQLDASGSASRLPGARVFVGSTVTTADAAGEASVRLTTPGVWGVRADKAGHIRSALVSVKVAQKSEIAYFTVRPTRVRRGRHVVARGTLTSDGAGLWGRRVRIQRRVGSRWITVRNVRTVSRGRFIGRLTAVRTSFYRAIYPGGAVTLPTVSPRARLDVIR